MRFVVRYLTLQPWEIQARRINISIRRKKNSFNFNIFNHKISKNYYSNLRSLVNFQNFDAQIEIEIFTFLLDHLVIHHQNCHIIYYSIFMPQYWAYKEMKQRGKKNKCHCLSYRRHLFTEKLKSKRRELRQKILAVFNAIFLFFFILYQKSGVDQSFTKHTI